VVTGSVVAAAGAFAAYSRRAVEGAQLRARVARRYAGKVSVAAALPAKRVTCALLPHAASAPYRRHPVYDDDMLPLPPSSHLFREWRDRQAQENARRLRYENQAAGSSAAAALAVEAARRWWDGTPATGMVLAPRARAPRVTAVSACVKWCGARRGSLSRAERVLNRRVGTASVSFDSARGSASRVAHAVRRTER